MCGSSGGWWQYDSRSSDEIETAYQQSAAEIELTLCGSLYCIDFKHLVQYSRENPTKKRKIKRDILEILRLKGVAGLLTR